MSAHRVTAGASAGRWIEMNAGSRRMRIPPTRGHLCLGFLTCFGVWFAAGCMQPTTAPITQASILAPPAQKASETAPVESNIVRVNKFFSSDPWLNFGADGTNKIDGVRFAVYLESANKSTGVFGTGRILVTMYELTRDAFGKEAATQIYEWDMPSEKAYPWRAKQMTALGWGYGFRLHWDPKLDLAGRQVAFVVKYFREDGRVITSSRQAVKVPAEDAGGGHLAAQTKPTVAPAVASRPRVRAATTAPRASGAANASP
jgi:hypothetical protein